MAEANQSFLILAPAISATAGLLGVFLGAWLTAKRETTQRQLKYIENQLSLFYSPLLGIRSTIQKNAELRVTIQGEAQEQWAILCSHSEALNPEEKQKITTEKWPRFKNLLDYDNQKFEDVLFPLYEEMLDCFRKNYWLADEETRRYYPVLLQFVEVWNRNLKDALPIEVWNALDYKEAVLKDFYVHIEAKHEELRVLLKNGNPTKSCCS
jgi:hypothetical protein